MRDPAGVIVPGVVLTVISGNQFQGEGNPGNQLQADSAVLFQRGSDPAETTLPLTFLRTVGNDKYYSATVPSKSFRPGGVVR